MDLTLGQKYWVFTRGGRTTEDVCYINGKPHILTWDGYWKEWKKTPVPDDMFIKYRIERQRIRLVMTR